MAETEAENGFELAGVFYPWRCTTTGKDLLLIDRISGMSPQEFFEVVEDEHELSRAPVLLALIATSMRSRHPEWSLERIVRTVMDVEIDDVQIIGGDEKEGEESPPSEAGAEAGPSDPSAQKSSNSPATPSETLHAIPA